MSARRPASAPSETKNNLGGNQRHKMIWLGAVSAVALMSATSVAAQNQPSGASQVQNVEELIVTAQKREERLVDVPAAITALQGNMLRDMGAKTLSDYAALVPGLQFASQGGGVGQQLVLRGLATGVQTDSALVGEIVDGIPVGSSSTYALGGASALDTSLWDVARVEVLRGPQGPLAKLPCLLDPEKFVYNLGPLNLAYGLGPATLPPTTSHQYLKNDRVPYFTDTTTAPLFPSPSLLPLLGVGGPPAKNLLFNFR